MRILFTNTGPWGTGSATVIDGIMTELLRRRHEVKVIFPDLGMRSPALHKYYGRPNLYHIIKYPAKYRGETFYTFPLIITDPHPRNYPRAWTYKHLTAKQLELYIEFLKKKMKKVIEEFRPHVIETEHVWLMGYVLSELGCGYVAAAHHSDQLGFRYDTRMRPYALKCAKQSRYIFAISDFVKDEVEELYKVDNKKVVVLPNGYNQTIFRPRKISKKRLLKEYGINTDYRLPVITFSGKLSKTKGVDVLLKANAILQKECPCLVILFGAGDIKDAMGRNPTDKERKHVYFMGHVVPEVLSQFHNIAAASVLPSRSEGFGIAALEAMGCGTPVVATRSGELERFIVGKIVPSKNPRMLAKGIKAMINMPQRKYSALRKKAYKASLKYSWKDIVAKRLKYYKKVRTCYS